MFVMEPDHFLSLLLVKNFHNMRKQSNSLSDSWIRIKYSFIVTQVEAASAIFFCGTRSCAEHMQLRSYDR